MDQAHWTARALCIFSLTSSLLAVYFAGDQVWTINRLSKPDSIRDWIRGGRGSGDERMERDVEGLNSKQLLKLAVANILPAPSSVLTISAPRLLLSAALKALLVGIGI